MGEAGVECLGEVGDKAPFGELGGGEANDGVAGRGTDEGESGFSFAEFLVGAGVTVEDEAESLVVGLSGDGAAFFSFTAAAAS